MRDVTEALAAWNSFYVMIGSSAAALTGLTFIVITLVSGDRRSANRYGVSTFTTPTVVHFGAVLFVAAAMSAPFRSWLPVAMLLGGAGVAGMAYVGLIGWRASRAGRYRPDVEDWTFHVALPFIAYALLALGALRFHVAALALFAPAAAAALLIFTGIHNAWDVVTFVTIVDVPERDAESAVASSAD